MNYTNATGGAPEDNITKKMDEAVVHLLERYKLGEYVLICPDGTAFVDVDFDRLIQTVAGQHSKLFKPLPLIGRTGIIRP